MALAMLRGRPDVMPGLKRQLQAAGTCPGDAVLVTAQELSRYKALLTSTDVDQSQAVVKEAEKQKWADLAQAKRTQIAAIDERRFRNPSNSDREVDVDFAQLEAARRSKRMQDEDRDEVKRMNRIVLQTKVAAIRDVQLEEKKAILQVRAEDERRVEQQLEVERLRAVKDFEAREQQRLQDRRTGALAIKAQMEEREAERLRRLEMKHQEQQAVLQHMEKLREDDRKRAAKKRETSQGLLQDIVLVNVEQIKLKARHREMELAEGQRIAEYVKEKDKREAALAEEQERLHAEREREVARLRSFQEKAQDLQAEADAARARRAQETYEREMRVKEQQEQTRKSRIERDLVECREIQKREKEAILVEQAAVEAGHFETLLLTQRLGDLQDRKAREAEKQQRARHQQLVKDQITAAEETRRQERRQGVEEGRRLRKDKEFHDRQVEFVRNEKFKQLEQEGIPDRYRMELLRPHHIISEPLRPIK